MTISSTVRRSGPYTGNGSTTTFAYGFKIFEDTGLQVVKTVAGVDTIVAPSSYSVSGVGNASGGNVVFTVAPAAGSKITIIGNEAFTQQLDLENQGSYYPEDVERALDRAAIRDQQLEERLDRAVTIPVGADPSSLPAVVENVLRVVESADNIDIVADNMDAVNAVAPQAAIIAANVADITNFADVYQGPKAADPIKRNDNSALQEGDLYFSSTSKTMRVYTGAAWRDASPQSLNIVAKSFTGNGVTTTFALDASPAIAANLLVEVGGVLQVPGTDYTVTGSTLTMINAPASGTPINTWVIAVVSTLYVPPTGSIRASMFPAAKDLLYLPAIRRLLRSEPDLGDYGVFSSATVTYGQSDFNAVVAGVIADGSRTVFVPKGNYRLGEQLTFKDGVIFEGEHKSQSVFKMYHQNTGMVFTGENENGGGLKKLSIINDSGAQCVAYIQLIANVLGWAPDFFEIEGVNLSGFSNKTSQYGIVGNGNARDASAANALRGLRNLKIRDTDIFNCDVLNLELRATRGATLDGVKCFQADGAVEKVNITGANAAQESYNITISNCSMGDFSLDRAERINGLGNNFNNVTVSANALNSMVGNAYGTVTNAGTGTKVLKSNATFV